MSNLHIAPRTVLHPIYYIHMEMCKFNVGGAQTCALQTTVVVMNTMQRNLPFCIYLRAVEVYTKCVANATMLEFFKVRGVCIVENLMHL